MVLWKEEFEDVFIGIVRLKKEGRKQKRVRSRSREDGAGSIALKKELPKVILLVGNNHEIP